MQNLSLNELEQIERINNLSLNELKEIVKTRHIKNYKDMSKEDLLIALLKSNKNHAELRSRSEDNDEEIRETKKIFNELRYNFSKKEIKKTRKNFSDKEIIDEYLEELEEKDSLTEQEKRRKKGYTKKLQKTEEYIRKLKEDLSKFGRHQCNDNDDLEYKGIKEIKNLFNKINEKDYYEPIKTKHAFDDGYIEYESRGDKDNNLSLVEYIDIIRPYLRDMIDNHKAHSEWKIQLVMKINFISSLDTDEFRDMYTKSNNTEIMSGTESNDTIKEIFNSFLRRYQEGLETKMKGSNFVFDSVDILYYSFIK